MPKDLSLMLVLCILCSTCAQKCILIIFPDHFPSDIQDICREESDVTLIGIYEKMVYASIEKIARLHPRLHVESSRRNEHFCDEVIGVVGNIDFATASIIQGIASQLHLNLTVVSSLTSPDLLPVANLPNILDMKPVLNYVDALVSFFSQWNWTRIGLINADSRYYQYIAEVLLIRLQKDLKKIITPTLTLSSGQSSNGIVESIKEYGTHVIVIVAGGNSACSILESAQSQNLTWPHYIWIVLSDNLRPSFLPCKMEAFFLKDLSFQYQYQSQNYVSYPRAYVCENMLTSSSSALSIEIGILHDAITAVKLAGDQFSNASFSGINGHQVAFLNGRRLSNISILKDLDDSLQEIAYYNPALNQLAIIHNLSALEKFPHGNIEITQFQSTTADIVVVVLTVITSYIFVTVVLIFYFYFHNEPEIKATSVPITFCMFMGCYMSITFVPLQLIAFQPKAKRGDVNICPALVFFSVFGIPFLLIMATLFVKMMRVYAIFENPLNYRKKFFSNPVLFLYRLLLILPNIIILVIWTAVDTYSEIRLEFPQRGYLLVIERCTSHYTLVWVSLLLSYISILIIALSVLALKTSKIRYRNFSDTKATNAFALVSIIITVLTITYWYFFTNIAINQQSIASIKKVEITLYTGHIALPVFCQLFLFVPKVYYPIKRHLMK